MSRNKSLPHLLLAVAVTPLPFNANAQEAANAVELPPLVVSATRQDMSVDELAHAVTVIDREQLDNQFQTSRNLGEVLAKTVPGMAPASQTLTNFNQSLRGRNLLVLIDGVPQNTNRNISRDLMNIDQANIERIEVLRGASAVYGSGAAGGVVNIITRNNKVGATTRIELQSSLTQLDKDGLGYRAEQYLGGGSDTFDYGVDLAWESRGAFYDAEGERIAPEPSQGDLSDTDSVNLAGKLRWFFDDSTLTLSANYFDAEQDTDYASDPSVAALPAGSVKAQAIPGLQLDEQNRTRNSLFNLSWAGNHGLLGSVDAQAYYRDYHARFTPADGRNWATWGVLGQTFQDTETVGSRLTINTPINDANLVRWGMDLSREKSEAPITTYDGNAYDSSGGLVFVDTGDRTFMPPITQDDIGAFVQLEHTFSKRLRGELGTRYEYVSAEFDDFTTLGQGNDIEGGEVSFDDFLFNAGLVFDVTETSELYANFSQGFELPDVGLQLRYAPTGFDISSSQLEPIKTDNYEIGARSNWGLTQTSVAVFYSRSDLGQPTIEDFAFVQPRRKERIYGVEATVDYPVNDNWTLGGLATWLKGESYNEGDQSWEALNGYRIPPLQLRAYTEYRPNNRWFHRLQANYSGSRDDAFEDQVGFGSREVESYTTVDFQTRYQVSHHMVSVGIENLLNEDYYTVYGQLLRNNNNTSHIPAAGTTLRASYQYQW